MQTVLQGKSEDEVVNSKAQLGPLSVDLTATSGGAAIGFVPYVDSDDVCTSFLLPVEPVA